MKRNNNFDVKGWMVLDLELKGNELMTFAIIYGFSQDEETEYIGSLSYIQKFLSITKPTASKVLNDLEEKGLIIKRQGTTNFGKKNFYRFNPEVLKKLYQGGENNFTKGGKETLPLNINKESNIDLSIVPKISLPIVPEFPLWRSLWVEWIDYRKREKKPKFRSVKTEQMAFDKLYKLANGNIETAKLIVEQSITNGYTGLFKLNNRNGNKSDQEKLAGY